MLGVLGPTRLPRTFALTCAAVLALRAVLAALAPITGDEAYFWFWGQTPDWGFYDHPPMIGWWLAVVQPLGQSAFVARLPALALPIMVAAMTVVIAKLVEPHNNERAYLAGLALLLLPIEWLNVLVSTDTPLVFFTMLSVYAYSRALCSRRASAAPNAMPASRVEREGRVINAWHFAAGAFLGLALLSKFFAGLLAVGYFTFALISPRPERRWPGLVVIAVASALVMLVNVWWNWEHCWANIMFNLYNRHGTASASWRTPLIYVGTLAYASGGLVLWQLLNRYRLNGQGLNQQNEAQPSESPSSAPVRLLACAALVPLVLFALLSIPKTIGLHWLFAFVPLLFILAAVVLRVDQLRRNLRWLGLFSTLHLVAVTAIALAPIETWSSLRIYDGIVLTVKPNEVLAPLEPYQDEFVLASDSYSNAVTLGFNHGRYFQVFGRASGHARQDDIRTDFRTLAGRNILILRKSSPPPADYLPYFDQVEFRDYSVRGATFHMVLGRGFRYEVYRDRVLAEIRDEFYRIPGFLPQRACYFCARYFGATSCPARARAD